jgi:FkbM family methyltransferase
MTFQTELVQTLHGPMYVLPNEVDPWVSRSYRELGEYSQSEFEFLKLILNVLGCQQGPLTVIDAGAYIGDLTIPLSRLVKEVYAFEPQAGIREVLKANLEINRISNVTVLPYALADKERPLFYNTKSTSKDGNLGGNMMLDEGDHSVEVRTLDSLGLNSSFCESRHRGNGNPDDRGRRGDTGPDPCADVPRVRHGYLPGVQPPGLPPHLRLQHLPPLLPDLEPA